jgi:hypothetical protein
LTGLNGIHRSRGVTAQSADIKIAYDFKILQGYTRIALAAFSILAPNMQFVCITIFENTDRIRPNIRIEPWGTGKLDQALN